MVRAFWEPPGSWPGSCPVGAPPREGRTVHAIAKCRRDEIASVDQLAKAGAAAPLMPTQRCAYYTIDKREAPDRAWALVVRVLEQLGFEGLDSEDSSSRTATIPEALLEEFEARAADPDPSLWIPSPPKRPTIHEDEARASAAPLLLLRAPRSP